MKSYTKIFIPFVLAILVGSLTFVFAQTKDNNAARQRPPRGEGFGKQLPGFRGGLPPHVIEQLNLTDAQKQQIQAFEVNSRDASKEYFEKIRVADEQLRTMVESGSFNEEQARQILNGKSQAMTELELIRLRSDAAILNILTAEQKTLLEQLKQQRPDFRGGRQRPDTPPQN